MMINNISGLVGKMILNNLGKTNADLLKTFQRLSTGRKINSASDDAAGLAVATRLESQVRGLAMAERNAQMGISYTQTAESYAGSVTDDLQRIRELSVQAANGTLTDADRASIQDEINSLRDNISSTLDSAEFNTKKIFDGHTETFQIGPSSSDNMTLDLPALSADSIGLSAIDVSTQAGAENAITQATGAMDQVLSVRTDLGATQNRLESTIESLSRTRVDTMSSLSSIMDANIAEEMMNLSQSMTSLESQLLLIAQVNKLDSGLLALLNDKS